MIELDLNDMHDWFGFGVAGNFAGHLDQAGEAVDFATVVAADGAQSSIRKLLADELSKQGCDIKTEVKVTGIERKGNEINPLTKKAYGEPGVSFWLTLGEDERSVLVACDLDTSILEADLYGVVSVTTGCRIARETDVLWLSAHADFIAALINRTGLDGGWWCPRCLSE